MTCKYLNENIKKVELILDNKKNTYSNCKWINIGYNRKNLNLVNNFLFSEKDNFILLNLELYVPSNHNKKFWCLFYDLKNIKKTNLLKDFLLQKITLQDLIKNSKQKLMTLEFGFDFLQATEKESENIILFDLIKRVQNFEDTIEHYVLKPIKYTYYHDENGDYQQVYNYNVFLDKEKILQEETYIKLSSLVEIDMFLTWAYQNKISNIYNYIVGENHYFYSCRDSKIRYVYVERNNVSIITDYNYNNPKSKVIPFIDILINVEENKN